MTERSDAMQRVLDLERQRKSQALRGQVGRLAHESLTMHQFHALAVLASGGDMPTAALGDVLGAKPSVVTGVVQRLVERGLVERAADPEDRRVHLVRLSDAGSALMRDTFEEMERVSAERLQALSDAQLSAYADILDTLVRQ